MPEIVYSAREGSVYPESFDLYKPEDKEFEDEIRKLCRCKRCDYVNEKWVKDVKMKDQIERLYIEQRPPNGYDLHPYTVMEIAYRKLLEENRKLKEKLGCLAE